MTHKAVRCRRAGCWHMRIPGEHDVLCPSECLQHSWQKAAIGEDTVIRIAPMVKRSFRMQQEPVAIRVLSASQVLGPALYAVFLDFVVQSERGPA